MPHVVTVTRTTTTSTSAIIWNTGYCRTAPGLLKIAEIIVGGLILLMLLVLLEDGDDLSYVGYPSRLHFVFFFQYIVVTFLIGSFLLLLGCLVSLSTGSIIAKTSYEFIYHGGAFILYTIATIWMMLQIKDRPYERYKWYFFSTALGVVNSVLYFISCVLAHRSYRWQ